MNLYVQMSAASNELDPGSDVDEPMASVSKVGLNFDLIHFKESDLFIELNRNELNTYVKFFCCLLCCLRAFAMEFL